MPKITLPAPSEIDVRPLMTPSEKNMCAFEYTRYVALGQAYRKAVRAFADAGCRYLQLDEVNFTYLCDPKLRELVANRGEDPAELPHVYARMINAAVADVPSDMTRAMHLCRGNFQSTFV